MDSQYILLARVKLGHSKNYNLQCNPKDDRTEMHPKRQICKLTNFFFTLINRKFIL